MSNIFGYKDQNVGLARIGYNSVEDEEVKQFNTNALNEYNKLVDEQKNFLFNMYSDEELQKIQNKGKMDLLEVSQKHRWQELTPYLGSGVENGLKNIKIHKNLYRLRNGELLDEHEKDDVKNYLKDLTECELRGRTLGGNLIEGLYSTVPFLFEAGIGFASIGEGGVGLLSLGQTGSKFALRQGAKGYAKKEIRKALEEQARKNLIDKSKKLAIDSTLGTAKFTGLATPTEVYNKWGEVQLAHDLALTERGQFVLSEAEINPAKALMIAFGDTMIENFSETSGVLFGAVTKTAMRSGAGRTISNFINKNVLNKLPKNFVSGFKDLVQKTTNLPFMQALNKYGYYGILEEMGEERIGDFLRVVCNLDGEEGYSFDQFARALFPSAEQLAVEAILFGLTGGAIAGGLHGIKKTVDYTRYKNIAENIKDQTKKEDGTYNVEKMKTLIKKNNPDITNENLNKVVTSITQGIRKAENYSLDDFLIDAGIFRTPYKESITDTRLRNILANGKISDEEVETIINFASNEEKSALVSLVDDNEAKTEEYNALKQDLMRFGKSEEEASANIQALTKIDEVLINKYNENGEAENLIKNRNLKILGIQTEIQKQKEKEFVEENLSGKNVMQFSAKDLKTDAKTFQYKDNSDNDGVTERLKDVQEWDSVNAGNVIVYENKEGERFIADGHQRLGLAKRLGGDIKLNGFLFREKDGYTPAQVRMIAAQKNIAEGSGTPIDTAKIIKELGGVENYPKSLPKKGTLYEYGIPLARLGDEAFEKVVNGFVTPAQGAVIGNIIRNNHLKQSLAIDAVSNANITDLQQTALMAREVLNTDITSHEQTNLFGTQEIFETVAIEKIKIVDGALKLLKKSKNLMAHLATNSSAIEKAGNVLNKKNNEDIKKSSELAIGVIEKMASLSGEISDKANDLAVKYKAGEITLNDAIIQFRDFCIQPNILDFVFGRKQAIEETKEENKQVALEGLEEESAKAEKKQQDEITTKENKEKYSTTQDSFQNSMFNTEQFKNGQQMLFDTSDMPSENAVANEELNNELPEFKPEEKPEELDKYEDFGEKISGAKKELWKTYSKTLESPLDSDFDKITLNKSFPEPNYEMLIREGVDTKVLATIKAFRDCIPSKPRKSYKKREFISVLNFTRDLAKNLINGEKNLDDIEKALENYRSIRELVHLYQDLGYPAFKNAKGYSILDGVTSFYKNGVKLEKPLGNQYAVIQGHTFIGNTFGTREEAIEHLRNILLVEPEKEERKTKLDIYQMRKTGEIIIGKKVGTNKYIDLQGGFTSSREARNYYKDHEAELLEKLQKLKEVPETRGSANKERIGEDYREGLNVTPEKFANEFGFRGVQFGNYVENNKRVEDINEAYDALLDLANLLDIPTRAISLNGSLGIAFGARGNGGKNPAKAHYEPAEVVINLTKKKGAGSLAHEWWHALDNFFGKQEGRELGYFTDSYTNKNTRKEIFEAYKNIVKVLQKNLYERSKKIDETRSKDYWSTTVEMTARGFEAYIIGKAKMKGFRNDYLANILTEEEYRDIERYPYPKNNEMEEVTKAYDNLFSLLKTKETEKGITFYQSAYHGTPHRFDNFSLEHIGSGEGNQAHGWGLYFAENREVSEDYRKKLTGDNFDNEQYFYDNNLIEHRNKKAVLASILENGKDKVIRVREKSLKNYKEYGTKTEYETKKAELEWIKTLDENKIQKKTDKGQLFEVDIPENDVLLDEEEPFSTQSENVKNSIKALIKDLLGIKSFADKDLDEDIKKTEKEKEENYNYIVSRKLELLKDLRFDDTVGKDFYNHLAEYLRVSENITNPQHKKEASLLLNQYGIKGITYDGRSDGRCYVVFDDKAVNIIEKYYQDVEAPRAKIEFMPNETVITLAQGNDASSFLHELAHMYLHDLQELATVNKRAEKDLKEVYDMLGFNANADYTEQEYRDMHEKFARSFEAYLLNGQAPTQRMKSLFEKFKEFLKEVYESLQDLNVEFSEEIKRGFDKLFTTDEEYENEVLPMYQQNDELVDSLNKTDTIADKIRNKTNEIVDSWKSFYDNVIIPIDTRLGLISPELKKILRKFTFNMTIESKKDCDRITPFLLKVKELKDKQTKITYNKKEFNAYNLLSYALNNRDSYTVNKVVKMLDMDKEFNEVRTLLDELHDQVQSVGIEIGYLESYFPRMVKTEKADSFIEMFEKMAREEEIDIKEQLKEIDDAEYSNVKRTIQDNDPHNLWNNEDKAKLINNSLRGFGKNNILLSRIGQLKFERLIDKLTPEQQQFYEPIEKALSNYVIGARKNIEERKFFGAENKEVSKLRASIKRKRETLRDVKMRTPSQAKWKELNRLKYELSPITIKLETISGEYKTNLENIKGTKDEEKKEKLKGYIENQKEMIAKLKDQKKRLEEQLEWTEQANAIKVKNTVIKRLQGDIDKLAEDIKIILGDTEHVEDSIGRLVQDLAEKKLIFAKDERIVRDLLVARFNKVRLEKLAVTARDASTIVTLNDITNAVTQITDLTFSAFKFGLLNTFHGMRKVEGLTRESLGLKNIAEEFRGASPLSSWLNKQLKIIGLDLIDGFAKNTEINASVFSARNKAKKGDKQFLEKLKFLFDDRAEQVQKDLIDGKTTDEIIFIAFNDLADIQPITTDQMTVGYQSIFKPLYVLKTYSIKALDIVRNECLYKISQGTKDKNLKLISEGLNNLIRLQVFMWLFGVPQDLLKDLLANNEFNIPESFIENLIIFGIFNRFMVKKVSDNPANIYLENVKLPIVQAFGDLGTGIKQVREGKKDIKDIYVWSRVPIIGKLYHNWLGGKKEKRVDLLN